MTDTVAGMHNTDSNPSPFYRVYRTVVQVVIALATAVPTAAAALDLPATTAASVSGIVAAIAIILSAIQNGLEHTGSLPVVGGQDKN